METGCKDRNIVKLRLCDTLTDHVIPYVGGYENDHVNQSHLHGCKPWRAASTLQYHSDADASCPSCFIIVDNIAIVAAAFFGLITCLLCALIRSLTTASAYVPI